MTIRQLKGRCWELDPLPSDAERYGHYDSRADAMRAIREAKRDDDFFNPATKPRRLDAPCWVVQCDGECETIIDLEDEGWIVHHESAVAAGETADAWRWVYSADARFVFCEEDAPEDGHLAPPSPAELEAAGQLRLPGVA